MEVYVRPFLGPGGRSQISTGGGHTPKWSQSGHKLFYESTDGIIMVSDYAVHGETFSSAVPRVWSKVRMVVQTASTTYDLAPDGQRIVGLMSREAVEEQKPLTHLTFLPDFFDELKRRSGAH